ncbi:MAG: AarF/ABC1/UbiB kinase family protein [Pseudomonadota bacterium]
MSATIKASASTGHFPLRETPRLLHIARVALRHGFGRYVERLPFGHAETQGVAPDTAVSDARRFRLMLEELGPTFVKFGQMLSVRQDLFATEVIAELASLQDHVPPFPGTEARNIIEQALGQPVSAIYASFDEEPFAAASIAQVHAARLSDGREIIVKVQRPGIDEVVRADIEVLYLVARLVMRCIPEWRRFDPPGLVGEFAETILRELDFNDEGRSADRFRQEFEHEPAVSVPRVYWELSGQRVLTMEHSVGQRITADYPSDAETRARLAQTLARLLLSQIFEHGFFHGDLHPGNIFLLPHGRLCFHDFGIVGRLSPLDQEHLRQLFLALILRDAEWMADLYFEMGVAAQDLDRQAFVRDLDNALDQYYAAAGSTSSFAEILRQFILLGSRHDIHVPRELLLVAKVFMQVESLCLTLDAHFNMLAALHAYVPRLVGRQWLPPNAAAGLAQGYRAAHALRGIAGVLPRVVTRALGSLERGELGVRVHHEHLDKMQEHLDRASNRLSFSLIIGAIVIGSSIVMAFHTGPHYAGIPLLGLAGYVIAAVLGLWWAVAILRSGKF